MASWTNEIWQHTETMIEYGTEACYVPKNTLFIKCGKKSIASQSRNDVLRNPGKPYQRIKHNLVSNDIIKKRTEAGMFIYPKERTLALMKNSWENLAIKSNEYAGQLPFTSSRPYAETGRLVILFLNSLRISLIVECFFFTL